MQITDALVQNLFGFFSALIGGSIGGIFTLKATDKALRENNDKDQKRDDKEVQNLLDALHVEMKALWDFHMKRIGHLIEALPEGKALEIYYPLTQDYFTIYHANAHMIGRIKDPVLREAIVICYNKCKKVVDGFKYNNELFRNYHDLANDPAAPNQQLHLKAKADAFAAYGIVIKEDHMELKHYVEQMLRLIETRDQTS